MTFRDAVLDAFVKRADAVPIEHALERLAPGHLGRLRKGRVERAGPCPGCGGDDRFSINLPKSIFVCRGHGRGGGPVGLALMLQPGLAFLEACAAVLGEDPPKGGTLSPEEREARRREAEEMSARLLEDQARRAAEQERFRERARDDAFAIWRAGLPIAGTSAARYLHARGLYPALPHVVGLRYAPALAYHHAGRVVRTLPAMLGAITAGRELIGVHRTWLSVERPGEKAEIIDPETGELLDARKSLGSVMGGLIALAGGPEPHTMFVGEGIETTLTAIAALATAGRMTDGIAAAAAVSLGNMAGPAAGRGKAGRRTPDLGRPGLEVPDSVTTLYLIQDDDTAPSTHVEDVMTRAAARHRAGRPGRVVRVIRPGQGRDLNDLVKGGGG